MCSNQAQSGKELPTYDDELLVGTTLMFIYFNELLEFVKEYTPYRRSS